MSVQSPFTFFFLVLMVVFVWGLVPLNLIYGKYVFRYWPSAE